MFELMLEAEPAFLTVSEQSSQGWQSSVGAAACIGAAGSPNGAKMVPKIFPRNVLDPASVQRCLFKPWPNTAVCQISVYHGADVKFMLPRGAGQNINTSTSILACDSVTLCDMRSNLRTSH